MMLDAAQRAGSSHGFAQKCQELRHSSCIDLVKFVTCLASLISDIIKEDGMDYRKREKLLPYQC
jgi:hypothetical protein